MFSSFEQGVAIVLGAALLVSVVTLYSTSVKPRQCGALDILIGQIGLINSRSLT